MPDSQFRAGGPEREEFLRMTEILETSSIESFRYAESPHVEGRSDVSQSQVTYSGVAHLESSMDSSSYRRTPEPVVQAYDYPFAPDIHFAEGFDPFNPRDSEQYTDTAVRNREEPGSDPVDEVGREKLFNQLLAAETVKAEERGRMKGFEMGLASGREEAFRQVQSERDRLYVQAASLTESFSAARETYVHRLEQEAARLALAIAARILRREAQADPLLLTGAVRVALGQLAASTAVRLRVPEQDHGLWEEALALMPGLALRPQVIGEPQMELGDCQMETDLGSADLGLWPQLKEIERGFFARVETSGQVPGDRRFGWSSEAEPIEVRTGARADDGGTDWDKEGLAGQEQRTSAGSSSSPGQGLEERHG